MIMLALLLLAASCGSSVVTRPLTSCSHARYFDLAGNDVIVISPFDGSRDTVAVNRPMERIICMSTSHVACLCAIGADSTIAAVSGIRYISNPSVRSMGLPDIGYEPSLDYERILSLNPDMLLTYTVSGAVPQYVMKLRALGIPVLILHDHLEDHPLARAEYVRLFGALTGHLHEADSLFDSVRDGYISLVASSVQEPVKVLLNAPYADVWYIPGTENYMSRLIEDAGGEVLGAAVGESRSHTISLETAYALSQEADFWIAPGHCRTIDELSGLHQLFPSFGPIAKGLPIYNNTLRTTPEGGNDFWESGAVRPDLILEDLIRIFDGTACEGGLNYFQRLSENDAEVTEDVSAVGSPE